MFELISKDEQTNRPGMPPARWGSNNIPLKTLTKWIMAWRLVRRQVTTEPSFVLIWSEQISKLCYFLVCFRFFRLLDQYEAPQWWRCVATTSVSTRRRTSRRLWWRWRWQELPANCRDKTTSTGLFVLFSKPRVCFCLYIFVPQTCVFVYVCFLHAFAPEALFIVKSWNKLMVRVGEKLPCGVGMPLQLVCVYKNLVQLFVSLACTWTTHT